MNTRLLLLCCLTVGVLAIASSPALAQCAPLGTPGQTGCGLFGTPLPTLTCTGSPNVGNAAFGATGTAQCIQQSPILLFGLCAAPPVPVTGPFGTNAFCDAGPGGCTAFVDLSLIAAVPGIPTPSGHFFPLPIPNDSSLVGATVCAEEITFCVLFVGVCLAVTNGLSITVEP